MNFSQLSHDFLMNFSWISHDFLMTFSWLSLDFLMTFSWLFHDFLLTFSWRSHDFLMNFSWLSDDFSWTSELAMVCAVSALVSSSFFYKRLPQLVLCTAVLNGEGWVNDVNYLVRAAALHCSTWTALCTLLLQLLCSLLQNRQSNMSISFNGSSNKPRR